MDAKIHRNMLAHSPNGCTLWKYGPKRGKNNNIYANHRISLRNSAQTSNRIYTDRAVVVCHMKTVELPENWHFRENSTTFHLPVNVLIFDIFQNPFKGNLSEL